MISNAGEPVKSKNVSGTLTRTGFPSLHSGHPKGNSSTWYLGVILNGSTVIFPKGEDSFCFRTRSVENIRQKPMQLAQQTTTPFTGVPSITVVTSPSKSLTNSYFFARSSPLQRGHFTLSYEDVIPEKRKFSNSPFVRGCGLVVSDSSSSCEMRSSLPYAFL